MNFHSRSYGHGTPLIILHGLLGSLDNWGTIGKKLGERFHVFAFDARNHGRSSHSEMMNYAVLADDLHRFMQQHDIPEAYLLGHSMGGKTAMHFAVNHPDMVRKLIVVDIAPKAYSRKHDHIFEALSSLDLKRFSSRKEIDEALTGNIPEFSTRQFLLKNLARTESDNFQWKMNLRVLREHYNELSGALPASAVCNRPALFVNGGKSSYVTEDDRPLIKHHFPNSIILTIKNAGHWVHADAPDELEKIVVKFLAG